MTLAITLGEPAGIGTELLSQLENHLNDCVLIGDPDLIARQLSSFPKQRIVPVILAQPSQFGQLNKANAQYVLDTIRVAALGCLEGRFDAMVTNPIHKGIINDAGIPFSGHTEYLAELTDTDEVVMMLLNKVMKVALVTTHLPLKEVAQAITGQKIQTVIKIMAKDLKLKFAIDNPHIAVCSLNPHAGEGGHLGHEEIDVIIPALDELRQSGYHISGPIPADTLFTPNRVKQYDAILAMYHDQGLAPLKYAGFGESVNITLGLPIIRTSVDHGTALDIAGQGLADAGSLKAAIELARQCVNHQKNYAC
ncbi:4-hydroxythreonine-4-phosphate dehydrogenase PdxA [Marinicella gelatinilytica]|uniref:4-hydroxythreonine-4-phosphate dehydrogenase PdxA n=1 Tax=Marinicella gelatinilytica TaxID=2996017 RepID=UPI002260E33F|nr:4-hydroxythreonine-4-phosphate dehydrogenase PdxA [Marinicella gelatinilytica]MCX7545697.1 4-hydroxythreonine-4-phosphate dehydrogenase PdxA [Marinicella gelatinilytica]